MAFHSFTYLLGFLPLVLLIYHVLRRNVWLTNLFLTVASWVFYAWFSLASLIPLLTSSVLDFYIGKKIHASSNPKTRKWLLITSLTVNLGILAFFKYAVWFSTSVIGWLHVVDSSFITVLTQVVLPAGLSFYTFQTMSYTIDIYRGKEVPCPSFVTYLCFVTLFPQLVAGPIERSTHLIPQLSRVREVVSPQMAVLALFLISWGLFKKIVLADNFGLLVELGETQARAAQGHDMVGAGWLFAYSFCFQIYCDFSAYTDIARGSALLIGIDLMRNFKTPHFARNPSDFWQRWHISLSTWLRDYLYIPLGGNRHGGWNTARNLLITMVLGGLWHGAGMLFIAWGLWHGLLLVLYHMIPIDKHLETKLGKRIGAVCSTLLFFHLSLFGWILFRASPESLPMILESMRYNMSHIARFHLENFHLFFVGLVCAVLIPDWLAYRKGVEFTDLYPRMPGWCKVGVWVAIFYAIILIGKRAGYDFIYFQF
jgi:alginate O-acetyltransferase complex protein AlgI